MHQTLRLFIAVSILLITSCNETSVAPKPAAGLALQFVDGEYKALNAASCPFTFSVNEYARVLSKSDCSMKIEYPQMDATVYINYASIQDNLRQLLIDGQRLSYVHNKKADIIDDYPYINTDQSTYGMMYEIEGNAASNAQFYVTDSTDHFLTAALYFYAKPNYDSILPAVDYVKKDMVKMMETLEWK